MKVKCTMIGHQLFNVAKTDTEPTIRSHASNNDLARSVVLWRAPVAAGTRARIRRTAAASQQSLSSPPPFTRCYVIDNKANLLNFAPQNLTLCDNVTLVVCSGQT